jgi:hypothetical protein
MADKTRNSLTAKPPDLSKDENRFMANVSAILRERRARAYAAVNFAMTAAYWEVGKRIVEQGHITKKADEQGRRIGEGPGLEGLCGELQELLAERNRKCKLLKQETR